MGLQPSYEMIVVCGTLILGIVLFSVVVIYNIFQVGIAQKVQEYGKIKALGATRKQMKQLIFREGHSSGGSFDTAGAAVWFPDCKKSASTGWWSREIWYRPESKNHQGASVFH